MPLNALEARKASEGRNAEAERLYRDALRRDSGLPEGRHSPALLLTGSKGREREAIKAFRRNLAEQGGFFTLRLSPAELLARTGDTEGVFAEYADVVKAKPDYPASHLTLGDFDLKAGQANAAVLQLGAAAAQHRRSPALRARTGDAGHDAEAQEARAAALKLQTEKNERRGISAKMAF